MTHRNLIAAGLALLALALLAVAGQGVAQAQQAELDPRKAQVVQSLSALDAEKLGALFEHIGIEPPDDFYECLCPAGFHYWPDEGGPCRYVGPLGGVTDTGFDGSQMAHCAAYWGIDDGRSILDAVAAATTPPEPGDLVAARVCEAVRAELLPEQAELKVKVEQGRRALDLWFEEQAEYRRSQSTWLNSLNQIFSINEKPHPGPVLATVNQDIGALDCIADVLRRCDAAVREKKPRPASDAAMDAMVKAFATGLASQFEQSGDDSWSSALTLKSAFNASPFDYRLGTEANKAVGYATACRQVANLVGEKFGVSY